MEIADAAAPAWSGIISREIAAAGIPGCAAATVRSTGETKLHTAGWADIAARRPVDAETVFHLFSGTKLVTATAVMILQSRGALSLDDPLIRHLPEAAGMDAITLRHLLTHTSGLQDTLSAVSSVHLAGEAAPDAAAALKPFRIHAGRPPGRVVYRNVNFALLGAVISRVSGKDYATFVTDEILQPLRMTASFDVPVGTSAATGYAGAFGPLWLAAPFLVPRHGRRVFGPRLGSLRPLRAFGLDAAAIGGLSGTASSFLPFLEAHLGGRPDALPDHARAAMQDMNAKGAAGIASREGMGLGWKMGRAEDGTGFLNHEGGGPGFTSELRLYTGQDLGIVVLMNRWLPPRRSHLVAHRICEAIRASD